MHCKVSSLLMRIATELPPHYYTMRGLFFFHMDCIDLDSESVIWCTLCTNKSAAVTTWIHLHCQCFCSFQAKHNWLKSFYSHVMRKPNIDCLHHTLRGQFEPRGSDHCFKVPEPSCENIVCSVLAFWSHPMYGNHILKAQLKADSLNEFWHMFVFHHLLVNSTVLTQSGALGENLYKNLVYILKKIVIGWKGVCH